ncbi:MAG: ABC transporter ATP-binding protein [Spirochaetales bacterium]|nr:ABC transporter ATP-binding protein [Spirochaetales bacterium]MCF7938373.1 ABC transporter ATP-binding protein [Spirochaetales bacterium]
MEELLTIQDLHVSFHQDGKVLQAVRGLDLSVRKGEVHSLVGESGSGKTVTSKSVMGLIDIPPGEIGKGSIRFSGREVIGMGPRELRAMRGKEIGMIFQEPARYLNPAYKVGEQIRESVSMHLGLNRGDALERAYEYLALVGLGQDQRILNSYPHELSGGMKQRAMIAMAIACNPKLLIADEPTTALDVTLQLQILKLLISLQRKLSMTVLFISHDLGVVREISDTVSVIYAGRIVERASKEELFSRPLHPYTTLLLLSKPEPEKRGKDLPTIPGRVPDPEHVPPGCAFHTRCPLAEEICGREVPELKQYGEDHWAACFFAGKKQIKEDG